jgi:hypothetical protein
MKITRTGVRDQVSGFRVQGSGFSEKIAQIMELCPGEISGWRCLAFKDMVILLWSY